jgi:hypothetical protein
VNLGDWLRARPTEYDLAKPETVNARANFFVGGRGIDFPFDEKDPSKKSDKAFWNQVALVWVDPEQLFRQHRIRTSRSKILRRHPIILMPFRAHNQLTGASINSSMQWI